MTQREQEFPALLERLRPQCEEILARYERKRSALLMLAHVFQEQEGFVSPQAMAAISQMCEITPAETEGTISFYTLLFPRPVGKYVLQPCRGLACAINGADETMEHFRKRLGIGSLETTADGTFSYEEVECLAACDRAPCMQVNLEFVYDLTPAAIDEMLEAMRAGAYPVKPLPQTEAPAATWKLDPDEQIAFGGKALGAVGVENPDNAGGVGDRSGTIMLDHIIERDVAFFERTRERAVVDTRAITEAEPEAERAGH